MHCASRFAGRAKSPGGFLNGLQVRDARAVRRSKELGSGLIDHSQKMTIAAIQIADMNVWAHRS